MIVYHGTTEVIKNPDIAHSKKYLDFGKGFYLTSYKSQAEKWALRKSLLYILHSYERNLLRPPRRKRFFDLS